jgi:hypothetical protein
VLRLVVGGVVAFDVDAVVEVAVPHEGAAVVVVEDFAVPAEVFVVVGAEFDAAVFEPFHISALGHGIFAEGGAVMLGGELLEVAVGPPLEEEGALALDPEDLTRHLLGVVGEPAAFPAVFEAFFEVALVIEQAGFLIVAALNAGEGFGGAGFEVDFAFAFLEFGAAADRGEFFFGAGWEQGEEAGQEQRDGFWDEIFTGHSLTETRYPVVLQPAKLAVGSAGFQCDSSVMAGV